MQLNSSANIHDPVTTARLVLRRHRPEDFDACLAMRSDPEVMRYLGGQPDTPENIWSRLLRYEGHWSWFGYGIWAVCEAETGQYVGDVGIATFRRDMEPGLGDAPELGWTLARAAQGKGYATEAVQAALAWAAACWGPTRTVCLIAAGNTASLRVAAKCGFFEMGRSTYKDAPVILFDRPVRPGI